MKFNPLVVITMLDGRPMREPIITDAAQRAVFAKRLGEIIAAPASEQPLLKELYNVDHENAHAEVTLGKAIIETLQAQIQGDEQTSGVQKIKDFKLCMRIDSALKSVGTMVEVTTEEVTRIKERAAKLYPIGPAAQIACYLEGENLFEIKAVEPAKAAD